jgi:hypothetical protein
MSATQQMTKDMIESLDVLPMLIDKFVVDFANGIHVTNDHIRVQKQRTGFGSRLADGWTGAGAARQAEINANLANGVESSLKWLGELSESLAQSNYAIVCVNNRLNTLKHAVAKIAHYSADTRQLLNALSVQVAERCGCLEHEVARIDLVQRVHLNMDHVFSKWAAGKYQHLALANRCYAALEELHWGAFGDFYRNHTGINDKQRFMEIAKNRAIEQLSKDANATSTTRFEAQDWLATPSSPNATTLAEALAYLGDAANDVQQPFIYSATQQPKQLPLRMPRLCSADRLGEAMLHEVFGGRAYV